MLESNQQQDNNNLLVSSPPPKSSSSSTNSNIDLTNVTGNNILDDQQQSSDQQQMAASSSSTTAAAQTLSPKMIENFSKILIANGNSNVDVQMYANLIQQLHNAASANTSPTTQQQQQRSASSSPPQQQNSIIGNHRTSPLNNNSNDLYNSQSSNVVYWNEEHQPQTSPPANCTLSALQQQLSMLNTNSSPVNINNLSLLQQQLVLQQQQQQQQQNLLLAQSLAAAKRPITGNKPTTISNQSSATSTNGSGNTNNSNSASQKTSPTSSNSLSNISGLPGGNWNQQWPPTQQQQQIKVNKQQLSTIPSTSLQQLNNLSQQSSQNTNYIQQQQPTTPKLNTSQSLTNAASLINKQQQQRQQQQVFQQQQQQNSSISGLIQQQRNNLLSSTNNYDLEEQQQQQNNVGSFDTLSPALNNQLLDLYRADPIQFEQLMKMKGLFGTPTNLPATASNAASGVDDQNLLNDENIPQHLDQTVPANMLNSFNLNRGSPRNSQNISLQQHLAQQQQQQQQLLQMQFQQQLLQQQQQSQQQIHPSMMAAAANMNMHGQDFREERFSRKVFVGGLPPDIDEEEIVTHFRRYGNLIVDWPHKAESKSYFPPKGYAFLIFQEERSVQDLIDQCVLDDGKLYMVVSSPSMKDKPVQIRPWCLADSDFVMDGSQPLDPRKTIFVGGVPRPLKAIELAMIMDRFYGGVCYAGIDTDPELKYPKGAGRVAFSNQQSYIAAISARFVQLQHGEIDKRVEVKPYVLDDQMCDECQGARCGGKFAPFFCANVTCLQYYCESCWNTIHSRSGREYHKPLVKEGADRPRPIPYKRNNKDRLFN